jgi:imidazolonepropionase-like amidohydrolase
MNWMVIVKILAPLLLLAQAIAVPCLADSFVVDAKQVRTLVAGAAPIENGRIVVQDGKITCIGAVNACTLPANLRRYDFSADGIVTPGFIETLAHIGQVEVDAEDGSHDGIAAKDSNQAHLQAVDGVAMASRAMSAARLGGVTTVVVRPLGGALVSGQSAAFRTSGLTVDVALVQAPVAVNVNLGEDARQDMPLVGARSGQVALLRGLLANAKKLADADHKKIKEAAEKDAIQRLRDDPGIAALAELVWRQKLPIAIHAHRSDEIAAALRLQRELGFRLVILGGAEAHMLAQELAAQKVPVVLGPVRVAPFGWNTRQARPDAAAILHKAGVQLALATADTHNARNLRFEAGFAAANGLPADVALAATTREAAAIFGLPGVGTLAVGQIADFAVFDGDPLAYSGHTKFVSAAGEALDAPQQR